MNAALRELDDASVTQRPEIVLTDAAGYWHKEQIERFCQGLMASGLAIGGVPGKAYDPAAIV